MTRTKRYLLFASLLVLGISASAQSFQPKNILFEGDTGHSNAELLAAVGLTKGMTITPAQINDHVKLLVDSGLFEDVSFSFNGQDLVFQLIPVAQLYPLRFENLPLTAGVDLDASLHKQLPLFHGKVPLGGSLLDDTRKGLEVELAAKGIKASITTTPFNDAQSGKVIAISFAITDPNVSVGEVQLDGATPALATKARLVLAKTIGSPYSSDGSPSALETDLVNYYGALGYVDVKVHASAKPDAVIDPANPSTIHIPFIATVEEGLQYKLGSVQLAPGVLIAQADFDKQSGLRAGEVVSLEKLRGNWMFLSRQYHNKGFIKVEIIPTSAMDRTQAIVSYTVSAQPGPQYTMGKFRVENVSDDLRAAIVTAWPMPPGAIFNEGSIRGMTATNGVHPQLERVFQTVNITYSLAPHEDTHTVDVTLRLEKKHP
jgi:outer membrane protein assembly factor BamA